MCLRSAGTADHVTMLQRSPTYVVSRPDTDALAKRYPKAVVSAFAGDPAKVTEMDALVAYLQMLGTLVDFKSVRPEQLRQ